MNLINLFIFAAGILVGAGAALGLMSLLKHRGITPFQLLISWEFIVIAVLLVVMWFGLPIRL